MTSIFKSTHKKTRRNNMTEGVRYPTFAFITGGAGQADDGIPPQPFETFCYDSALMQAKIENFNVVPYTSVLPKELFGKIVPINDKIVSQFKHGAGAKTKTANSSAVGLRNMLNFLTPRLTMTLPKATPRCG